MATKIETTKDIAANAATSFTKQVKGFTYVKDYACITVELDGKAEKIIIGDKMNFPMSDMFQLKSAESVSFTEREPKTVNGTTYRRFSLDSINF